MPTEPIHKRLVAFVDGHALYHAAREAFGYVFPNYDVTQLAQAVAELNDRGIDGTEWIKINKALYDLCIDPIDHRPKPKSLTL